MKPWMLALVVAVAFAGGLLAGGGLLKDEPPPAQPAVGSTTGVEAGPGAPRTALASPGSSAPSAGPPALARTPATPSASPTSQRPPPTRLEAGAAEPPPAPPPPPPDALAEGERERQVSEGGPGNGDVTHLVYEFESEAERLAWEERRRASWSSRLAREREIKVRALREQVGLTAAQEPRLIELLDAEAAERQRLVDALAAGAVSRSSFDEQVHANVARAREALARLLTPEQLGAYEQLAPREQVLRDEAH